MSWMQVRGTDGEPITVELTELVVAQRISRAMADEFASAVDKVIDHMVSEIDRRWVAKGWTLTDRPKITTEVDHLTDSVVYRASAMAYVAPGTMTEVDRQVEADCRGGYYR